MPATITAIAHYYPEDKLTNKHFESYLDTSDEWIKTRTGINERRIMKNGATSDMIVPAALKCIENAGIDKQEIDLSTNPPKKVNTLLGGIIFGLGWALVGGCPGPLYALVGAGNIIYLIPIIGLLLGTMAYGLIKNKLPH